MEKSKNQDLILQIDIRKTKYNQLLKNKTTKNEFYKWLKSELAYTSNNIEGNTLTRKETQLIIEENLTTASKPFTDYLEAKNHAKAFEYILEILKDNKKIDENIILTIHKKLLTEIDNDNAGFYRNCRVRISGSRVTLPNPMKVPELMSDFFKWLNKNNTDAINAHLRFVSIHPFADGNGRTARLLMNLILMKSGYCPIIIRPRDRKRYITSIEKAQLTNDAETYNKFMLNALKRSFDNIIDMFDLDKENPQEKLLTISRFAKMVNLPVSTIRYWVKIEKLKPISYTESGYMLFSKEQSKNI